MALTRIKSNTSSFLQPSLGEVVTIVLDPGIDWLKVGFRVHIPNGGVYQILNRSGFVYELKLLTAIALPGQVVIASIVHPVDTDSETTKWGGERGKEW